MIKRNKNIILFIMLVLVTAVFSIMKIRETKILKNQYRAVSIRFTKEGVTSFNLNKALEEEKSRGSLNIPEVTAWTIACEAQVFNNMINRSVTIRPVITDGDMSLAAPMTLLYGNYVYRDDKKGCVLDVKTAYALFGTENAVGSILQYQEKDYYVRGVVKIDYPLFIVQEDSNTVVYSNLELLYKDKEMGETYAGEFIFQHSFGTDYKIFDGYFFTGILNSVMSLPAWIFFAVLIIKLGKLLWCKKASFKASQLVIYGLAGLIFIIGYGVLLYQFTGVPLSFPQKLIPSKWSDFDYWSKQFQLIKNQIHELRYVSPNPKDITLYDAVSKGFLNFIIMVMLHIAVLFRMDLLKKYLQTAGK